MNTNPVFKLIDYILIIVFLVIFAYFANMFLKNQAIDGCAKSYTYSQFIGEQNATVTYPSTDLYEKCLKDKGIK